MALPTTKSPPFRRASNNRSSSPSPVVPSAKSRQLKSPAASPLQSRSSALGHFRNHSFSPDSEQNTLTRALSGRARASSLRNSSCASGTFAPRFIKFDAAASDQDKVGGIEGENDFSGKTWVWIRDPEDAFVKSWLIKENDNGKLLVQCEDGSEREVDSQSTDKVNPAKFDKASDMAELTHLNEPSVVHNLQLRYQSDLIYTYSGLFLVAVNPYAPLPIYTREYINLYRGRSREDVKPHIYAVADEAFRHLVEEGKNQSILVTGESGAGKTENTKKVIQYLAAVATCDSPNVKSSSKATSNLSQQILRANPILEAFGNAQTVRNNNSSRFGKFIRIQFTRSGQISGALIDWYLLEKSRVVKVNSQERNYHVFYQLLRGSDQKLREDLLLSDHDVEDFEYTRYGNDAISGVSDVEEWNSLIESFHVMGFSKDEQKSILTTAAAVLHLGNVVATKESMRADQAMFDREARSHLEKASKLLGVSCEQFSAALLKPRVKAGREWVEKVQTPDQVRFSIDALSKGIYERCFGDLVDRINRQLNRSSGNAEETHFIGVLDIAGFEIFEKNSFEQLCINYTNEKLQQFFNHHMFVLEQEEYAREQIEWKFIDFGRDLQPTIDLIELTNPIGIFSCLDEDSVMPRATDKTFTEKLHSLWHQKTNKYRPSLLKQGFMITHYAAEVEYSTEGWLEKNKDPLQESATRLLAASSNQHIAKLFYGEDVEGVDANSKIRVKKGLFRTVAQRHKEQLSTLMTQLHLTHPHFVRCILPNHKKRPKLFNRNLVLDQLRCNGVLEGIRIARTGFPNRLPFHEFRSRYEVLCPSMPRGTLDGQEAARLILEKLALDPAIFRVGLTKVFFRAGVLADLEEQRDRLIHQIMCQFQSVARAFTLRRAINKRLYRADAARLIQRNFQYYLDLRNNPWWNLLVRMRPLLGVTRQSNEIKKREETIQKLQQQIQHDTGERQKLDEERRKTEFEMQQIQQMLESERALALDKDEIFRRLQERESELTEKLAGALEDQESLEQEIDELMLAKQKAQTGTDGLAQQLEQAGEIIANLEAEKNRLSEEISDIKKRIDDYEQQHTLSSHAEEELNKEIRVLNSQLDLKERKIQDLEGKVLKADHDIESRLSKTSTELQTAKKQLQQVTSDNQSMKQQLTEVSSTSSEYEDKLRLKESELALLKGKVDRLDSDRQHFEGENRKLSTKHDALQSRLHDVEAELDHSKAHQSQVERELTDAQTILQARLTEDAASIEGRKMLECQVDDLKTQLYTVQAELTRERQSRDDVQMLGEHKYNTLKRDHDSLNQAKITIEKELYVQQDVLRRTSEARQTAERERKERQDELRGLRQRFLDLQEAKLKADTAAERTSLHLANERETALRSELDSKERQLEDTKAERSALHGEVQRLKEMVTDSDSFRLRHDQEQERLERELVTVKGRLTASENDNRALLNKVQQKNLDIARSNSRATDSQRTKLSQLQADKSRQDEENKNLQRQLDDAKLLIASLEKQKEKMSLSLEDLDHEITREHKTSRNAEKAASSVSLQLAEANRKLETERQLKLQSQNNSRAIQSSLDQATKELGDCHNQLMLLQKVFNPESDTPPKSFDVAKVDISKTIDLVRKLEDAEHAARVATERYARAEAQIETLKNRHEEEVTQLSARHASSKRAMLEELDQNQLHSRQSPTTFRARADIIKSPQTQGTPPSVQRHLSNTASDSAKSDRTIDSLAFTSNMDLVSEVELLQNQLQMSEMRNRHLQSQIERSPSKASWQDESPSLRRVQRLERENTRLHGMLDDSTKKVSTLENSIRTGELTLKEVQTKSHEELFDLINSQEQSRKSLLQVHNTAVAELADAKIAFDDIKSAKATVEVDARDAKSELEELKFEREHEEASRAQLLQEFSELQIRLDTETSKLQDTASSLDLYKARADEYYNKLEQAEIAVMKASRAEQFAKSQCREAENSCATIMSERQEIDAVVEDLQRQVQGYEARIEDVLADLDGATQAKKRLQNELEDYRGQRATDIEEKETSMEQMRKKYQLELSALTGELDIEREHGVSIRTENSRIRDELEELRAKWDDEVLNSSTWAKEKSRLELTLQDLSNSRDEANNAHTDAQSKVVSLLSQLRNLRTSTEDLAAERDAIAKEKKNLEYRLKEAGERLEELSRSDSPSMRKAAGVDRELLQVKSDLAQQQDIATAAVDKMRRSEMLAQEVQKEIATERETNVQLHKEKASLDKTVKDLQLRLVDMETKGYSSTSTDVRFLNGRIQELEKQVEGLEDTRNKDQRSVRNVDRTVRDLQSQIERRDKANAQLTDDISKSRDKVERLLKTIDELQSSDSENQLAAKRAERELKEEREKSLRLEREVEGWKGLRMERNEMRRSGTYKALSDLGATESIRRRREGSLAPEGGAGPENLQRNESLTKGFL